MRIEENFTFVSNSLGILKWKLCPSVDKLLKKLGTLVRFHDGIIAS